MKVKVLLKKDIPNLGKVGDLVEVAAGYARNYLIPKDLAVLPTPGNVKAIERYKQKIEEERRQRIAELRAVAEKISQVEIKVEVAATEEGHLYGSVSARDIASRLAEAGYSIEAEQVRIEHPFRQVGEYSVPIHLGEDVFAEVKLTVVRREEEGEVDEQPSAAESQ